MAMVRHVLGTYRCRVTYADPHGHLGLMIWAIGRAEPVMTVYYAPSSEQSDPDDPRTWALDGLELFIPYDQCTPLERRITDKIWPLLQSAPPFAQLLPMLDKFLQVQSALTADTTPW